MSSSKSSSKKITRRSRGKKAQTRSQTSPKSFASNNGEQTESSATAPENFLSPNATLTYYSRISLCVLAVLGIISAIYFARSILFPMALAVVLFFLLAPLVRLLTRFQWVPEWLAAGIVVLGMTSAIAAATYGLSGPVSQWFSSAPKTFRAAEKKLRFMIEPVDTIDKASEEVKKITTGSGGDDVVEVSIKQPPVTNYLLSATMNFLAGICITVVLVYLLLAMGHRTLNSVVELIPMLEDKRGFVEMIRNVELGISQYLLTITAINALLGLVIGSVLGLIGLPDPILLGLMACLLNFIPFVGCFLGAAVTFLIGIVYLDTPSQALWGPMLYLAINTLEGNLITPLVLGRSMKLNPPIVFVFIIFWGWVWGVGGILIAVPLLGMMKIVCDHFTHLKPVSRILAG